MHESDFMKKHSKNTFIIPIILLFILIVLICTYCLKRNDSVYIYQSEAIRLLRDYKESKISKDNTKKELEKLAEDIQNKENNNESLKKLHDKIKITAIKIGLEGTSKVDVEMCIKDIQNL